MKQDWEVDCSGFMGEIQENGGGKNVEESGQQSAVVIWEAVKKGKRERMWETVEKGEG